VRGIAASVRGADLILEAVVVNVGPARAGLRAGVKMGPERTRVEGREGGKGQAVAWGMPVDRGMDGGVLRDALNGRSVLHPRPYWRAGIFNSCPSPMGWKALPVK
jgi:hypothetical protein